jgi:hypothetical protein
MRQITSERSRPRPQGSMLDSYHARSVSLGTHSVLGDRSCQPRMVAAKRIPGGRKSHSQSAPARPTPLVRRQAIHPGRVVQFQPNANYSLSAALLGLVITWRMAQFGTFRALTISRRRCGCRRTRRKGLPVVGGVWRFKLPPVSRNLRDFLSPFCGFIADKRPRCR